MKLFKFTGDWPAKAYFHKVLGVLALPLKAT